jgi:hypothetical protein
LQRVSVVRGVRPRARARQGARARRAARLDLGPTDLGDGGGRLPPTLACEQDSVIATGATLEATVTYSSSFAVNTSFGADDEFIGTPFTATATFTNAPGATIAITATQ